jgi:arginyl-tRNA synthetase
MIGYPADILTVKFQQMIKLVKNGQEFKMSKRTGNSLTLQDMLDTIGKDAAR